MKKVLAIENYELSKQKRASLESQSLGKEKEENNNARMPTFFNFQGEQIGMAAQSNYERCCPLTHFPWPMNFNC